MCTVLHSPYCIGTLQYCTLRMYCAVQYIGTERGAMDSSEFLMALRSRSFILFARSSRKRHCLSRRLHETLAPASIQYIPYLVLLLHALITALKPQHRRSPRPPLGTMNIKHAAGPDETTACHQPFRYSTLYSTVRTVLYYAQYPYPGLSLRVFLHFRNITS